MGRRLTAHQVEKIYTGLLAGTLRTYDDACVLAPRLGRTPATVMYHVYVWQGTYRNYLTNVPIEHMSLKNRLKPETYEQVKAHFENLKKSAPAGATVGTGTATSATNSDAVMLINRQAYLELLARLPERRHRRHQYGFLARIRAFFTG